MNIPGLSRGHGQLCKNVQVTGNYWFKYLNKNIGGIKQYLGYQTDTVLLKLTIN